MSFIIAATSANTHLHWLYGLDGLHGHCLLRQDHPARRGRHTQHLVDEPVVAVPLYVVGIILLLLQIVLVEIGRLRLRLVGETWLAVHLVGLAGGRSHGHAISIANSDKKKVRFYLRVHNNYTSKIE